MNLINLDGMQFIYRIFCQFEKKCVEQYCWPFFMFAMSSALQHWRVLIYLFDAIWSERLHNNVNLCLLSVISIIENMKAKFLHGCWTALQQLLRQNYWRNCIKYAAWKDRRIILHWFLFYHLWICTWEFIIQINLIFHL